MKRKKFYYAKRTFSLYIPLVLFLIGALFPLYWMIVTSIKPNNELMSLTEPLIVKSPTVMHYEGLLKDSKFVTWFKNGLIVSFVTTLLSVVISAFGAYALSRMQFAGRWFISRSVLFSYLVPRTILFIPLYAVVQFLRLTDSLAGLMLVYLTFMVPFCTWFLIGYFEGVPKDIEECATIDGCNRFQILTRITIPVAIPGVITAAIFSFTLSWNEFLYPLVFNTSGNKQVIPVGISTLMTGDLFEWGKIMAAGVLFTLPLVLIYYPIQKYIAEGATAGAVK